MCKVRQNKTPKGAPVVGATVKFGTLADGDLFSVSGGDGTVFEKMEGASFTSNSGGHPILNVETGKGGPNINDNDDVIRRDGELVMS